MVNAVIVLVNRVILVKIFRLHTKWGENLGQMGNRLNCIYCGFVQSNFYSDNEDTHLRYEHLNIWTCSNAYCRRLNWLFNYPSSYWDINSNVCKYFICTESARYICVMNNTRWLSVVYHSNGLVGCTHCFDHLFFTEVVVVAAAAVLLPMTIWVAQSKR